MPPKRWQRSIPAAALAGWQLQPLAPSTWGAQSGIGAVPLLFVRVAEDATGPAGVRDLCLPLAAAPTDEAVAVLVAVNGIGSQIVTSAWLSDYAGADDRRYLGAFIRLPIPPLF
jgi:hypothetical protein